MHLSGARGPLPGSCGSEKNPVLCGCRSEVPVFLLAITQGSLLTPKAVLRFSHGSWLPQSQQQNFFFFKSLKPPLKVHTLLSRPPREISFLMKSKSSSDFDLVTRLSLLNYISKCLLSYNLWTFWEWDLLRFSFCSHWSGGDYTMCAHTCRLNQNVNLIRRT